MIGGGSVWPGNVPCEVKKKVKGDWMKPPEGKDEDECEPESGSESGLYSVASAVRDGMTEI